MVGVYVDQWRSNGAMDVYASDWSRDPGCYVDPLHSRTFVKGALKLDEMKFIGKANACSKKVG